VNTQKTVNLDYRRLVRESRNLDPARAKQNTRIAILSDAATQQFVPLLRTLFHENGVNADIYEGAFDGIELEVFDPSSKLYKFQPDVVIIANCTQALRNRYFLSGQPNFVEMGMERILHIWDALQQYSSSRIVQFNFPLPYVRQFGHYDIKIPHSLYATTAALNAQIAAEAQKRSNILLCNVESIASDIGRKHWFDDRLWNMSKTFCQLEHLPVVAQAVVEIVLSTMGRMVKCVVLDLDNTLWGGIVGDDGH
jgi:predicted enzyme involved in methoxymalonyl-ACP biosynthesis